MKNRSILWLILACCFSWCVVLPVWAAPLPLATSRTVNGTVYLRRQGVKAFSPLARRTALYAKDVVGTGADGKVTLLFGDGAQIRLGPNSAIEITATLDVGKGRRSLFRALNGEIWARLRPGNAIQTRTVSLGVRGTEVHLDVAPGDGTTTLTVVEGEVNFWNQFGEVVVQQSQQSIARPGQAPTAPITVQNAGFIIEWTLDLERVVLPREKFFVTLDAQAAKRNVEMAQRRSRQAPKDAAVQLAWGDALFDTHRYNEALQAYDDALRLSPEGDKSLTHLLLTHRGYALLEVDRLPEARADFRRASSEEIPLLRETAANLTTPDVQQIALNDTPSDNDTPNDSDTPSGSYAPALVGLAWADLTGNTPEKAQKAAEAALEVLQQPRESAVAAVTPAVAESEADALIEARVALGVALLRQPSKIEQAVEQFVAAQQLSKSRYSYQAPAWLSLALVQQGNYSDAIEAGQEAIRLDPDSALAQGNLALAYFYSNHLEQARSAALSAVRLNPESVAAQVTLGQASLAQGDVDAAVQEAARAVALDPALPQAQYLLGVASAGRRDYDHAARALRESLRLAPDFLPAASALAQVYNTTARPREAVAVLDDLLPRHRNTDAVLDALGSVYYQQGRYSEAESQFRQAVAKRPNSALYQADLARTLLYSNRLNGAIEAGQAAVRLAPEVGQYHAVLGLAYDFSQLRAQAEREFRTALSLDPRNSLALAQLAYRYEGTDLRPAASSFTQAFVQDPAVARQLLRGGVGTELTPVLGNDEGRGFGLTNRITAQDGKLNTFSWLNRNEGDNDLANSDNRVWDTAHFLTYVPGPRTNLYASLRHQRARGGLSGSLSAPDDDDNASFGFGDVQLAARQRLSSGLNLWLGVRGVDSRQSTRDPNFDSFLDPTTGLPVGQQRANSDAFVPEARLDWALNSGSRRPGLLSMGVSYANSHFDRERNLLVPVGDGSGNNQITERDRTLLAYGQISQRVGDKLSILAQLRAQSTKRDTRFTTDIPGQPVAQDFINGDRSALLPSLLATYQANRKTLVRLAHNKRLTAFTESAFAPNETLISTQRAALPYGTPDSLRISQIDVERTVNERTFVKLFAFQSRAENVLIGGADVLGFGAGLPSPVAPLLTLNGWAGKGAGAQLEQRLGRSLFLTTGVTLRSVRAAGFDRAPYEPRQIGNLGLNYVSPSGTKIGVTLRHNGRFFQDSPLVAGRPEFPSRNYLDLYLGKEPSVRGEVFVAVTNLFNSTGIRFNDFPTERRRIQLGSTRRF